MPVLTPITDATQINAGAGNQYETAITVALRDGSRRYVLLFVRGPSTSSQDLIGRIYGADRLPVTPEFDVDPGSDFAYFPSVAALPGGDFVVAWIAENPGEDIVQVYVRRFTSSGSPLAELRLDFGATQEGNLQVEALDDGSYVVVWDDFGAGDIHGRVISAGNVPGPEFLLNTNLANAQLFPSVAWLPGGGFVGTWSSDFDPGPASDVRLIGQVFAASGAKVGGEFTIESGDPGLAPTVSTLEDGRFVVTYTNGTLSQGFSVVARIYTPQGQADGPPILVDIIPPNLFPGYVISAALSDGGFASAYTYSNAQGVGEIYLQVFSSDGEPAGAKALVASGSTTIYLDSLAVAPDGTIIVSWTQQQTPGLDDVFTRTYSYDVGNGDPAAQVDSATVTEAAVVSGNLLANDTGETVAVTAINGIAADVGQQITLESGALLTVNADGTFSYDPNDAYNHLTAGTGFASRATEIFSYTITGGTTANVSITITGLASPEDAFVGTAGNDTIVSDGSTGFFDLSAGGNDSVTGGSGNDGFFFGTTYNVNDRVAGGAGGNDQLGFQGSYAGFLGTETSITGIETLALLSSSDTRFVTDTTPNSYSFTSRNGNVAAGATLTVNGNGLQAGENFTFNGAAETDGAFTFFGGFGTENLTGGGGNDGFMFGAGRYNPAADRVNGGGGTDNQLALRGDYSGGVAFAANAMTNIQTVALISSQDSRYRPEATPFNYNLTLNDGNVAVDALLTVTGVGLQADEVLVANGAAETNGRFRMIGGGAGDTLTGGAGDDVFFGGLGADLLSGGGGANRFVYTDAAQSTAEAVDQLFGFDAGDVIDLAAVDADVAATDNQDFSYIGGGTFTGAPGELRALDLGGNQWRIEANVDGDLDAELVILVSVQPGFTFTETAFA